VSDTGPLGLLFLFAQL